MTSSQQRLERVTAHLQPENTAACPPRNKSDIAQHLLTTEESSFQDVVSNIKEWWQSPRWKHQTRPYTAEDVARLRSPVQGTYASGQMAKKAWAMFQDMASKGTFSHTFGSLDPVQVAQMAKYLTTIYVSGWQCSSTASTTNEPGPDLADYPYTTVPNKVDHLFRAQDFHARKQVEERSWMSREERASKPAVDYYRPIIADGDTGHGGITAVMKLTKLFIEKGAAGLHLEDQNGSSKKCGHMAGKVLVPTQAHIDRLVAARLQADIMKTETLIVARTDAEAATLLESNVDPRDHPFILGATNESLPALNDMLAAAQAKGASKSEQVAIMNTWADRAKLKLYKDVIIGAINSKPWPVTKKRASIERWTKAYGELSHAQAKSLAIELLGSASALPYWCMEKPRTREGFYRIEGGLEFCVTRARAYAPYSDLIWMETKKPGIKLAEAFASGVRRYFPHQLFAYNLSPSFNWDAAGMTEQDMANFQIQLGKLGFVWQFITLAGFHSNALAIDLFARDYSKRHILAYVQTIQRREREEKVETLTHQKWSGAEYVDTLTKTVTGGLSSTTALQHGNTEAQFAIGPTKSAVKLSKPTEEEFDTALS